MDYVMSILAPPPLSPHFQAGGVLEGWNEDLVFIATALLALAVLDVALVRPFLRPKARYFALHAAGNAVAAVAAWPDVWSVLSDPLRSMRGPSSTMVANSVIAAVHLYHCIAFKLRPEDIFHHVTFTAVLCGLGIPFKHVAGAANNFGCFFLSGLPGGVDYVLLVLVKHGIIESLTEKRVNASINAWCRMPSMIVYGWVMYQAYLYGEMEPGMGRVCPFIAAVLHVHNGVHYGQQAMANYGARKALAEAPRQAGKKGSKGSGAAANGAAKQAPGAKPKRS